jgi:hypothetical protein
MPTELPWLGSRYASTWICAADPSSTGSRDIKTSHVIVAAILGMTVLRVTAQNVASIILP